MQQVVNAVRSGRTADELAAIARLVQQAMLLLANAGIEAVPHADGSVIVAGKYSFWPVAGYWRTADGSRRGYDVRNLIAVIKGTPELPRLVKR